MEKRQPAAKGLGCLEQRSLAVDGSGDLREFANMQVESKFYERLHGNDVAYGKNAYNVSGLMASPAYRRWLQRCDRSRLRVLDIGCGKAQFLFDITEALRTQYQASLSRVAVVDLVRAEGVDRSHFTTPSFFSRAWTDKNFPPGRQFRFRQWQSCARKYF